MSKIIKSKLQPLKKLRLWKPYIDTSNSIWRGKIVYPVAFREGLVCLIRENTEFEGHIGVGTHPVFAWERDDGCWLKPVTKRARKRRRVKDGNRKCQTNNMVYVSWCLIR